MNVLAIATAVFIAIGFGGWPIIASYSRASGGWVGVIMAVSTAFVVTICSLKNMGSIPMPGLRAASLLLVAGLVNGLALFLYSGKVSDANIPTAAFVVTTSIMMAMAAPLMDWLLNSTVPNANQLLGFGLAIVAIYFLGK